MSKRCSDCRFSEMKRDFLGTGRCVLYCNKCEHSVNFDEFCQYYRNGYWYRYAFFRDNTPSSNGTIIRSIAQLNEWSKYNQEHLKREVRKLGKRLVAKGIITFINGDGLVHIHVNGRYATYFGKDGDPDKTFVLESLYRTLEAAGY